MFKPSFFNIVFFWLVKYAFFYVALMFKNQNYAFINIDNIKEGQDLFYYLWLFLFMPILCMLFFTAPVYLSFKLKNTSSSLLILMAVLVIEYFVYTYLASPSDYWNGIFNAIIGILVFIAFFYKYASNK